MVSENLVNQADGQLCDYEMVFIVRPTAEDDSPEATIDSISRFITGKGGVVSEVEHWGKRKLAYPIKQHGEGHYVLSRFQMKPEYNKELEMSKVRVAIIGVGNCASSLVQGVQYYKDAKDDDVIPGLMHVNLGGYHIRDIEFSAAFDIDV